MRKWNVTTTNYGKVRNETRRPPTHVHSHSSAGSLGSHETLLGMGGHAETQVLCTYCPLPWVIVETQPWGQNGQAAGLLCICKTSSPRQAWAAGDIVSCLIDLDDGTLSFCL